MTRASIALLASALALLTHDAGAAPPSGTPTPSPPRERRVGTPCAGCVSSHPGGATPAPLLVVLHGDHGHGPAELHDQWVRAASSASTRLAVLSLACPREEGCRGSYWQWNGAPSWIMRQVASVRATSAIDASRLWLVGWSGGASYMGLRAQELEAHFAAMIFHGGGIPPSTVACSAERRPVLFLVGDANPLHGLAVRLRQHFDRCGNLVAWNLLPRADHAGEWRGLSTKGADVIRWLATRPSVGPTVTLVPQKE